MDAVGILNEEKVVIVTATISEQVHNHKIQSLLNGLSIYSFLLPSGSFITLHLRLIITITQLSHIHLFYPRMMHRISY